MKTLFKNANLINELGDVLTNQDLLVVDGKIAEIGENLCCEDAEIIDCTDRFITPGFACSIPHSHPACLPVCGLVCRHCSAHSPVQ